jgi:hypothetical protein
MTVMLVALAMLVTGDDAHATRRRRAVRCCVMVPSETEGETRPYCFVVTAESRRGARHACRALGGRPRRPGVR